MKTWKKAGIAMGAVSGAALAYLATVVFAPVLKVEDQPVEQLSEDLAQPKPDCRRSFQVVKDGDIIRGWMYEPQSDGKPMPCVVMSHGLGATKDGGLEPYALRFVEAGYVVLTYDYRHYGESGGLPRQIYCGPEQLEDLRAVIQYARRSEEIDSDRIYLWGTSAGASYGVIIASEDHDIAGVIAQCGAYDHKEDSKVGVERNGYGFYLKLFMHAQRDKGRSRFGLSRHMIPPYGKPGTFAFIRAPGVYEGVMELAQGSKTFRNEICAAFMLMPHIPDVNKVAAFVKCPVLIQVCEEDEIVSPKSHLRLVQGLGEYADLRTYPIGHFEIYTGDGFELAVRDQVDFLKR